VQVVLVVSALLADAVALWAIAARITEFGFSPNRVAALGENVILLVNLAWSAVLYIRFLRGRGSFAGLERWQTDYLPVYAVWAAIRRDRLSAGVRVHLIGCRCTRSPQRHSRTRTLWPPPLVSPSRWRLMLTGGLAHRIGAMRFPRRHLQ
jgi:hypothetical protein